MNLVLNLSDDRKLFFLFFFFFFLSWPGRYIDWIDCDCRQWSLTRYIKHPYKSKTFRCISINIKLSTKSNHPWTKSDICISWKQWLPLLKETWSKIKLSCKTPKLKNNKNA
jgi:hypothetical protein